MTENSLAVKDLLGKEADTSLLKFELDVSNNKATVSFDQKDYTYLAVAEVGSIDGITPSSIDGYAVDEGKWVYKLEASGSIGTPGQVHEGDIYWRSLWYYNDGEKNVHSAERPVEDIANVDGGVIKFTNDSTSDVCDKTKISNMKIYRVLTSELTALGVTLNDVTRITDSEVEAKNFAKQGAILELLADNTKAVDVTTEYVKQLHVDKTDLTSDLISVADAKAFNTSLTTKTVEAETTLDQIQDTTYPQYVNDKTDYSSYFDTRYGAIGTLTRGYGNCVDQSHLLLGMYRTAQIPARYCHATCYFTSGLVVGHVWVEVYVNGKWYSCDTTSNRNSFGVINNWYKSSSVKRYNILPF